MICLHFIAVFAIRLPLIILGHIVETVQFRLRNGQQVVAFVKNTCRRRVASICSDDGPLPKAAVSLVVRCLYVHAVNRSAILFLGDKPGAGVEKAMVFEIQFKHPLAANHCIQSICTRFDLGINSLDVSDACAVANGIDRRQCSRLVAFRLLVQRFSIVQQNLGITEQRPRESCPVGSRSTRIFAVKARILKL